jgi:tRNA pseudouridine38-40 synthase
VVGLLRSTLARTLRLEHEPSIVGAGRTDAGVHAFHQVVHVDLPRAPKVRSLEAERLRDSLNKQLRGRVQILSATPVPDDFHARFSATWREYRYLVLEHNAPGLDSTNAWAWSVKGPLDLAAMNRAASRVLGTHDFRAFCRRPANGVPGEPLYRRVVAASWERFDDTWVMSPREVPALRLSIRAQSFCHNMVRCLVSSMIAVGAGTLDEGEIDRRLESGDRHQLPQPAPAAGLALIGVGYETLA